MKAIGKTNCANLDAYRLSEQFEIEVRGRKHKVVAAFDHVPDFLGQQFGRRILHQFCECGLELIENQVSAFDRHSNFFR